MSISSEITRITNAKNAIAAAISAKGVIVPSGAKIDDMPALIDDISGGGNYQSKSVTYTSNGTATITPDAGYDALSEVNVTVDVGGGGGAIDTCTVIVHNGIGVALGFRYTAFENGSIIVKSPYPTGVNPNTTVTLQNVVCGSVFTVYNGYTFHEVITTNGVSVSRDPTWQSLYYVTAPTTAGAIGTVTLIDTD